MIADIRAKSQGSAGTPWASKHVRRFVLMQTGGIAVVSLLICLKRM
jgi:hypothetical protein